MRDHLFLWRILSCLLAFFLFQNGFDDFYLWLIYFILKIETRKQTKTSRDPTMSSSLMLAWSWSWWFPMRLVKFMAALLIELVSLFNPSSNVSNERTNERRYTKKSFLITRFEKKKANRKWFMSLTQPSTIEIKLITKCIIWRLNERHECGIKPHFPSIVRFSTRFFFFYFTIDSW